MNYSADVKQAIASYENRGYEKQINPVSKQVQVKKACQVTFLKFKSTDELVQVVTSYLHLFLFSW